MLNKRYKVDRLFVLRGAVVAKKKLSPRRRAVIKKIMLEVADAAIIKRDYPNKVAPDRELIREIERSLHCPRRKYPGGCWVL